jgi:glucose dehydrogenase
MPGLVPPVINAWHEKNAHGAVMAIDPRTGTKNWAFEMHDVTASGILTTAGDVLFTGGGEGSFYAVARNGNMLWKAMVVGDVAAGPISYEVDGKQFVAVAAGTTWSSSVSVNAQSTGRPRR